MGTLPASPDIEPGCAGQSGEAPPPQDLLQFIKNGAKFIIAGHKEPDGDCTGSQLALQSALIRLGKTAIVCSAGPFKRTELKNYAEKFINIPTEDDRSGAKFIIVDCSGIDRTGDELKEIIGKHPFAVIDHHAAVTHSPSTPDAPVYVDSSFPSCTLLIEKLITALGLELTSEEATYLLFGVCTDTGFFRHLTEKNHSVFESVSRIVSHGASPKNVYRIISGGKSLNSRILLGHILSRSEAFFDGRLIISHETLEDFTAFGYESRDSDSLNKMLQSIEGVEAIVIIRQERVDNCTVSLRSIDKVDVSKIAAELGGGGHKNASGLTIRGEIAYVKQIMLESFKNAFIN